MRDETNPILEFLAPFDKLQLEVLAVHVAIHQRLFKILASRLGASEKELPDLKFMHAATMAFAGNNHGNIVGLLQKLDSVRNVLAHESDLVKFNSKFAAFARDVLGPNYHENPPSIEDKMRQDYSALEFVKVVVETTNVG